MNVGVKFGLARIGIFLGSAAVVWLLSPAWLNGFSRLMIAFVLAAAVSYFALKRMRDELAQAMAEHAEQRRAKKEGLRAALAGEDEPS